MDSSDLKSKQTIRLELLNLSKLYTTGLRLIAMDSSDLNATKPVGQTKDESKSGLESLNSFDCHNLNAEIKAEDLDDAVEVIEVEYECLDASDGSLTGDHTSDTSDSGTRIEDAPRIEPGTTVVKSEYFNNSDNMVVEQLKVRVHKCGFGDYLVDVSADEDRSNLNSLNCQNIEIKTEPHSVIEEIEYENVNYFAVENVKSDRFDSDKRIVAKPKIEFEETLVKSECCDDSDNPDIKGLKVQRVRRFKCTVCNYAVNFRSELKRHMLTHTGEKPYKCNICEYASSKKSDLKRHIRTHTGERPFKCTLCDYAASLVSVIKLHMRAHAGDKKHKCSMCNYAANHLSKLKCHMRQHTGEKPYKCTICDYAAAQASSLRVHMRKHTGERPYKCTSCQYAANRLPDLRKHIFKHTGEKPYKNR